MNAENGNPNEPTNPPSDDYPAENWPVSIGGDAPNQPGGTPTQANASGLLAGINRTWLYAGGGGLAAIIVVVIVLIVVLTGGGPSVPAEPMGLVLDDSSVVWQFDMQGIFDGDAPRGVDKFVEDAYESRLDEIGITVDEIETLIFVANTDRQNSLLILKGGLDFEDVRDELDDLDYDDDEYRGYEFWEGGNSSYFSDVALLGDEEYALLGFKDDRNAVQDILKALDRNQGLLIQDPDNAIIRAMDKAGEGWLVMGVNRCVGDDIRGCEAGGVAYSEGDRDSATANVVMLFRTDSAADRGSDDIEDIIDDYGLPYWSVPTDWDVEEVESDGEFVLVEVTTYFDN